MREKEEDGARPRGVLSTTRALSKLCPPLARRAPVPTLKSSVILAFSNKATSPNQKKKKTPKQCMFTVCNENGTLSLKSSSQNFITLV